ncbi:thiol-disulfide oxidoreductase dcc [Sulfitobacter noctilucae]|nr:thiol-disulfide oxidoreductase dcc [Sulfitobacter noctilucae]
MAVRYDDATDQEELRVWGITPEDAAKRFHVRKNGVLYGGIPAFVVLWQEIPQTRWLARLVSLPGINWLAIKVYDHAAAPLLYQLHLRRQHDF